MFVRYWRCFLEGALAANGPELHYKEQTLWEQEEGGSAWNLIEAADLLQFKLHVQHVEKEVLCWGRGSLDFVLTLRHIRCLFVELCWSWLNKTNSCCWSPWWACSQSSLLSPTHHPAGSAPCPGAGVCRFLVVPFACSAPPSGLWWMYSSPPSQTPALHAGPAGWSAPQSIRGWRPPPDAAVPPVLNSASASGLQRRQIVNLNQSSSYREPETNLARLHLNMGLKPVSRF